MKKIFNGTYIFTSVFIALMLSTGSVFSQVAINSTGAAADSSAMLDLSSTSMGTLFPRMSTTERNAIQKPAASLLIFNTDVKCFQTYISGQWQDLFCGACTAAPAIPGSISGNNSPCENATGEGYSITQVAGATSYSWTAPAGATIVSGQGSSSIIIDFGTASGNITVTANNACGSSLPQTLGIILNTVPTTAGAIDGSANVCAGQTGVVYSILAVPNATSYVWTYTGTGATINGSSNSVTMDFSGSATSGNLSVYGVNICGNGGTSPLYNITVNNAPAAPTAGTHTPGQTQIVWNWNTVSGATAYYYNTTDDFAGATNNGTGTSNTQQGLSCNTSYTLYVWAANSCGHSSSTVLTSATTACCQNQWTQKASMPAGAAERRHAISFTIGNNGYVGTGTNDAGSLYRDFWVWNQSTNTWTQKADYPYPLNLGTGFSIGAKGYSVCGDNNSSVLQDLYEYDTTANTWTQKSSFPGASRRKAVAFSIGTVAYVGLGKNRTDTYYSDFFAYDQATNSWTAKTSFPGGAREHLPSFSIGNYGYLGTGSQNDYSPPYVTFTDFWRFDPTGNGGNGSWLQLADFPGGARHGAVGFAIGTKGYIATGYYINTGTFYSDCYEYDTAGNSWTAKANFGGGVRAFGVGFSIGNMGCSATGTPNGAGGNNRKDLWEFCP